MPIWVDGEDWGVVATHPLLERVSAGARGEQRGDELLADDREVALVPLGAEITEPSRAAAVGRLVVRERQTVGVTGPDEIRGHPRVGGDRAGGLPDEVQPEGHTPLDQRAMTVEVVLGRAPADVADDD